MEEETVTISKKKYNKMIKEIAFLECLRAMGVDNWEGYSEAWQLYKEENE